MAAPVGRNAEPKWINPCGFSKSFESDPDMASDYHSGDLLERILLTARNALNQAELFRETYVRKTFNQGFDLFHNLWITRHYDWLPSTDDIPKNLSERLPEDHLNNLKLDVALTNAFHYLQKFAVGLEQVTWDQGEDGDFRKDFNDSEFKLRSTLCEVQIVMLETNVNQPKDVDRDIMEEPYRDMKDATLRNLRDWVIFRDYMNGLEYVIQVFEYFKNK